MTCGWLMAICHSEYRPYHRFVIISVHNFVHRATHRRMLYGHSFKARCRGVIRANTKTPCMSNFRVTMPKTCIHLSAYLQGTCIPLVRTLAYPWKWSGYLQAVPVYPWHSSRYLQVTYTPLKLVRIPQGTSDSDQCQRFAGTLQVSP